MKIPETLGELFDVLRASGVHTFSLNRPDVGELSVELGSLPGLKDREVQAQPSTDAMPSWKPASTATIVDAPPRISDIELALNPPELDYDDLEAVDPEEVVGTLTAPRESAPDGAADPDPTP